MLSHAEHILSGMLFFFLPLFTVKAQDRDRLSTKHAVYLEVLGGGGYGSLNYERFIPVKNGLRLNIRAGISTYRLRDFELKFNPDIILPFSAGIIYGKAHSMEIGLGQTYSSVSEIDIEEFAPQRKERLSAFGIIGYRVTFRKPAIMLRIAYTPVWEFYDVLRHWAGLSFGYSF